MTTPSNQPQQQLSLRDKQILDWIEAKNKLQSYKKVEMELRERVLSTDFQTHTVGTNHVQLGNGFSLKAIFPRTYKTEKTKAAEILATQNNLPAHIKHVFVWEPKVNKDIYESMTSEEKRLVTDFITIEDGTASLDFVEPPKAEIK